MCTYTQTRWDLEITTCSLCCSEEMEIADVCTEPKPSFSLKSAKHCIWYIHLYNYKMCIRNDGNVYATLGVLKTLYSFVGQHRENSNGKDTAL